MFSLSTKNDNLCDVLCIHDFANKIDFLKKYNEKCTIYLILTKNGKLYIIYFFKLKHPFKIYNGNKKTRQK